MDNNYKKIGEFSEGMAMMVSNTNGKIGYMDTYGNPVITPQFDNGSNFYKGIAIVELDNKWGVINKEKIMVSIIYDKISEVNNGFCVATLNGANGLIDLSNEEFLKFDYDDISFVNDFNIAAVKLNNKSGFINIFGKEIIPCMYDDVDYINGIKYIIVQLANKYGIIDMKNNNIIFPKYDEISFLTDSDLSDSQLVNQKYFKFKKDNRYGISSFNDDIVIEPIYKFIGSITTNFLGCEKEDSTIDLILNNKIIVSNIDSIFANTNCKNLIYKKNNKFHIINCKGIIYDNVYDGIEDCYSTYSLSSILFIKDNKYYYLDLNKDNKEWKLDNKIKDNDKVYYYGYYYNKLLLFIKSDKKYLIFAQELLMQYQMGNNSLGVSKKALKKIEMLQLNDDEYKFYSKMHLGSEEYNIIIKNGLLGLSNDKKMLIPPIYDEIKLVKKDLFLVSVKNKSGIINIKNEIIYDIVFDNIAILDTYNRKESFILFKKDNKFSIINLNSKKVISEFILDIDFSKEILFGFIKSLNEKADSYLIILCFEEGTSFISIKNNKVISSTLAAYDKTSQSSYGMIITRNKDTNKYGVLNENLDVLLDSKYDNISSFINNTTIVKIKNRYGAMKKINGKLEYVLLPKYNAIKFCDEAGKINQNLLLLQDDKNVYIFNVNNYQTKLFTLKGLNINDVEIMAFIYNKFIFRDKIEKAENNIIIYDSMTNMIEYYDAIFFPRYKIYWKVKKNNKYNILNLKTNKFILDDWFDILHMRYKDTGIGYKDETLYFIDFSKKEYIKMKETLGSIYYLYYLNNIFVMDSKGREIRLKSLKEFYTINKEKNNIYDDDIKEIKEANKLLK